MVTYAIRSRFSYRTLDIRLLLLAGGREDGMRRRATLRINRRVLPTRSLERARHRAGSFSWVVRASMAMGAEVGGLTPLSSAPIARGRRADSPQLTEVPEGET